MIVKSLCIKTKIFYCNRWNNMRLTCASDRKIGLCLELSADLPSQDILNRWLGEPIKNLMIPTSLFLTNRKGFPVLSHAHQAFLKLCALQKIQLLLTGANRHSSYKHYVQYLEHVYQVGIEVSFTFFNIMPIIVHKCKKKNLCPVGSLRR